MFTEARAQEVECTMFVNFFFSYPNYLDTMLFQVFAFALVSLLVFVPIVSIYLERNPVTREVEIDGVSSHFGFLDKFNDR